MKIFIGDLADKLALLKRDKTNCIKELKKLDRSIQVQTNIVVELYNLYHDGFTIESQNIHNVFEAFVEMSMYSSLDNFIQIYYQIIDEHKQLGQLNYRVKGTDMYQKFMETYFNDESAPQPQENDDLYQFLNDRLNQDIVINNNILESLSVDYVFALLHDRWLLNNLGTEEQFNDLFNEDKINDLHILIKLYCYLLNFIDKFEQDFITCYKDGQATLKQWENDSKTYEERIAKIVEIINQIAEGDTIYYSDVYHQSKYIIRQTHKVFDSINANLENIISRNGLDVELQTLGGENVVDYHNTDSEDLNPISNEKPINDEDQNIFLPDELIDENFINGTGQLPEISYGLVPILQSLSWEAYIDGIHQNVLISSQTYDIIDLNTLVANYTISGSTSININQATITVSAGSINLNNGKITAPEVTEDTVVTITATYKTKSISFTYITKANSIVDANGNDIDFTINENNEILLSPGETYNLRGTFNNPIVINANPENTINIDGQDVTIESLVANDNLPTTNIIFNGVTINSTKEYGILYDCPEENNAGYKGLYIQLEKDSQNFINCNNQGGEDTFAAIDSWKNLTIVGVGYITITNNVSHGIRGEEVNIAGPHIWVSAAHDGIHGKTINVYDGKFNINNTVDGFGTTPNGKINIFGGYYNFNNISGKGFDSQNSDKHGCYTIPGLLSESTNMDYIEDKYTAGTIKAYPTEEDYDNNTNSQTISIENNQYVIPNEYSVIKVSGKIINPIIRNSNGGSLDIYLNKAVIVTSEDNPSIAYLPESSRLKIIAVKDTINAIINKTTEGSNDLDAVKSENNMIIEIKKDATLYVTSAGGDGLDTGDLKITDSKGNLIINNCGERGIKGTYTVIGPNAEISGGNITTYNDPIDTENYSTFDGILVVKDNCKVKSISYGVVTEQDPNVKLTGFADIYGRNGKHTKGKILFTNNELKGIAIVGSIAAVKTIDLGNAKNLYLNEIISPNGQDYLINDTEPVLEENDAINPEGQNIEFRYLQSITNSWTISNINYDDEYVIIDNYDQNKIITANYSDGSTQFIKITDPRLKIYDTTLQIGNSEITFDEQYTVHGQARYHNQFNNSLHTDNNIQGKIEIRFTDQNKVLKITKTYSILAPAPDPEELGDYYIYLGYSDSIPRFIEDEDPNHPNAIGLKSILDDLEESQNRIYYTKHGSNWPSGTSFNGLDTGTNDGEIFIIAPTDMLAGKEEEVITDGTRYGALLPIEDENDGNIIRWNWEENNDPGKTTGDYSIWLFTTDPASTYTLTYPQ